VCDVAKMSPKCLRGFQGIPEGGSKVAEVCQRWLRCALGFSEVDEVGVRCVRAYRGVLEVPEVCSRYTCGVYKLA
jgi:hypothetical protein